MKLLVTFCWKVLVFLFFSIGFILPVYAQENNINVLNLMSDAQPIAARYQVNMTIKSPYKVVKVTPYYYSQQSKVVEKLPTIEEVYFNVMNFDFEHIPQKEEYLLLHLEYGPHFVFNRHSEAICMAPIRAYKVVENIDCNTFTTTQYLLAGADVDIELKNGLFTHELIQRMISLKTLPSTQSWHNYQSIITFTLNHISEKPEYLRVNLQGNYLSSMLKLSKDLRKTMLNRRKISLFDYEGILRDIDNSMVNTGYRILISMDTISKQYNDDLEFVVNHPTYMQDFFSGLAPFKLIEPESMSLANVKVKQNKIIFTKWPWFEHVKYSFDKGNEGTSLQEEIDVKQGASHAYIRPYGSRGKYLRSIVQVGKAQPEQLLTSKSVE